MRRNAVLAIMVAILVAAVPAAVAQEEGPDKMSGRGRCSPTGIWYGGSVVDDTGEFFKWLINVTPNFGGRFIITAENGFSWGVPVATNMNGDLLRVSSHRYELFLVGLQDPVGAGPPAPNPPLVIAVHGEMEMVDCNSIVVEYDFQGVYLWGDEPFVDLPIQDLGPGSETYTRLANPEWPPDW